ncbi:hypothetical protein CAUPRSCDRAFT_11987 [Caulochytrium protostelioides]|nr:hypothetical protein CAUPRSCDRAFT_11987 [Caulochytrium protostelioides]
MAHDAYRSSHATPAFVRNAGPVIEKAPRGAIIPYDTAYTAFPRSQAQSDYVRYGPLAGRSRRSAAGRPQGAEAEAGFAVNSAGTNAVPRAEDETASPTPRAPRQHADGVAWLLEQTHEIAAGGAHHGVAVGSQSKQDFTPKPLPHRHVPRQVQPAVSLGHDECAWVSESRRAYSDRTAASATAAPSHGADGVVDRVSHIHFDENGLGTRDWLPVTHSTFAAWPQLPAPAPREQRGMPTAIHLGHHDPTAAPHALTTGRIDPEHRRRELRAAPRTQSFAPGARRLAHLRDDDEAGMETLTSHRFDYGRHALGAAGPAGASAWASVSAGRRLDEPTTSVPSAINERSSIAFGSDSSAVMQSTTQSTYALRPALLERQHRRRQQYQGFVPPPWLDPLPVVGDRAAP